MTLQSLIEKLQEAAQGRGKASITIKIEALNNSEACSIESKTVKGAPASAKIEKSVPSVNLKWWVMFLVAFATMIAAYLSIP